MNTFKSSIRISCVLFFNLILLSSRAQVSIDENSETVVLKNEYAAYTFNKNNADLKSIQYLGYGNILGGKGSAYLSGPNWSLHPSFFSVTTQRDDIIDISFKHKDKNHFEYDLHYVLKKGLSGIYVYLIEKHSANDSIGIYEQTRWGLRADPNLFDYHLVRDSIQGPMYDMDSLESGKKLQDWTYQMKNGKIYTKYDYADYIDGRYVHGMAGTKSHIGLFVIQASHEYLNGGPTKQYMTVHSSPYLICMLNCSHFLATNRRADDTIIGDWDKLNGPFLLYLNKGNSLDAIWEDAKNTTKNQKAEWPYTWLDNKDYPLKRGSLVIHAKDETGKALHNITFVLADSAHDWQAQSQGYLYWEHTNKNGIAKIENIRPGHYTLYGFGADRLVNFRKDGIDISTDKSIGLSTLLPSENHSIIWQIGKVDRSTKGFYYASHARSYGLFDSVPANLAYTIGKNKVEDWYYAQTKLGEWNILFSSTNISNSDSLTLYLSLAGVSQNPTLAVLLNGNKIGEIKDMGNDRSIYRSAVLGGYYQLVKITFPSSLLLSTENVLKLKMINCKRGGGILYDAIRLSYN